MLDSLTLALLIVTTPVQKPNMDRVSKIVAPSELQIIAKAPKTVQKAESLTTCYESSYGSCWSENWTMNTTIYIHALATYIVAPTVVAFFALHYWVKG